MKKVKLINNVSSLYKMNYHQNNTNVYIKRDDILDFALGGNKVRLWEYIAKDILDKKAEKVITFGSAFSNHIRVAAIVASILNIECDLIILVDENEKNGPNLDIANRFKNVKMMYCKSSEATEYIDNYLAEQTNNYYWVPGGGHMPLAAMGYVDAAKEIKKQIEALNVNIDAVFLPCGTGTTQAGLIYEMGDEIPVIGVSVARTIERCKTEIESLFYDMDILSGKKQKDDKGNIIETHYLSNYINVIDNMGHAYGHIDKDIRKIILEIASSDGLILDPIYNAKAFLVMQNYLKEHEELNNVLFINTGGSTNISLL